MSDQQRERRQGERRKRRSSCWCQRLMPPSITRHGDSRHPNSDRRGAAQVSAPASAERGGARKSTSLTDAFLKWSRENGVNGDMRLDGKWSVGDVAISFAYGMVNELTAAKDREIAELRQENEKLREYARHKDDCQFAEWECSQPECEETHSKPCTCDLADLRKREEKR